MRRERAAIRAVVGEDDPGRDRDRIPAPLSSDDSGQSPFPIDGPHQLVDVDELRLQLDDEQDPARRMPGEDVDDPALAIDREGHLGFCDPALERREHASHRFVHRSVAGVEHPAEVAALPANDSVEPGVERIRHPSDLTQRDGGQVAALDPPDDPTRDPRASGEIVLTPPLTASGWFGAPNLTRRSSIATECAIRGVETAASQSTSTGEASV